MFTKVLISDDLGSINEGVIAELTKLSIENVIQVKYCDDAYLKIKSSIKQGAPYDLFITDLSFIPDHRTQRFTNGEDLIKMLKIEHSELKVIVFSVEDRLQKVRTLIKAYEVDGYVCKGRKGLVELNEAIKTVFNNEVYVSPQVKEALNDKANLEIDDYDITLLKHLSEGASQEQISELFKEISISPSSLSSVEKRLNKLRIQFKANNVTHLVTIVKDLGLI